MQHPDEGTIHAWLDGALPAGEARALEVHLAGCAACGAAVAEARGLLAASSRILSALDAVPGGVLPAASPEALGIAGMKASRIRASRWHSTPWRAAAAIVLVGSVGWLATRSGVRQGDESAQQVRIADTALEATAAVDTGGTLTAARMAERGMIGASTADRVPPAVPAPGRNRSAAKVAPQSQSGFIAAQPVAPAGQMARENGSRLETFAARSAPGVGAGVGAATGGQSTLKENVVADEARREAPSAGTSAGVDLASGAGTRELQRKTASSPPSVLLQTAPTMANASAQVAKLMPGSETLRRLSGCYALEMSAWTPAAVGGEPFVFQLPRRIELLTERAPLADGLSEMVLRPGAGEPPFAAGIRGAWRATGGDGVQIRIGKEARWVSAMLRFAGDSVSGTASVAASEGEVRAAIKGKKIGCQER